MKILLFTYRDIGWLIKPYILLHKKYSGIDTVLIAEEDYSNGEFDFLRPEFEGEFIRACEFGKVLKWALSKIDNKYVIVMLGDYLIRDKVNSDLISTIMDYMDQEKNIIRCEVGNYRGIKERADHTNTYRGYKILENNFAAMALTPGLWDRKKLLNIITDSMDNPWAFEIVGDKNFTKNEFRSICIYPEPINYINVIRGRDNENIVVTPQMYKSIKKYIPPNIKVHKVNMAFM